MDNIRMGLRLLETLTSALYEDPIVLFREYVQNSVDAYISNPITDDFNINITVNKEKKIITFIDNGHGIPPEKFIRKMTDIAKSDKGSALDQIGFRGIGRLSAMPFCETLIFSNKIKGRGKIQSFQWNGKRYLELLEQSEDDDLNAAISKIATHKEVIFEGNKEEHFFKVEVISYFEEIDELVHSSDFETRLCLLLPLRYSDEFQEFGNEIAAQYRKFMNQELGKYQFDVYVNEKPLYKPFNNNHILESDLVFWPLQFKAESDRLPPEKIGLLWFTFNRKVTSNNKNDPRGIWVRSKNMLVGNQYSLAEAVSKSKDDYIATFRDLTQTLNGVYGEMLIDTTKLSDNARRDWFKIDPSSIQFRMIVTDFLRKLIAYRYAASKAFNDLTASKKKDDLIKAYNELTKGLDTSKLILSFKDATDVDRPQNQFEYAEDDIPRSSITVKRFYDKVLSGIRKYCMNNDEDELKAFIKMRTYLKRYLNDESNTNE